MAKLIANIYGDALFDAVLECKDSSGVANEVYSLLEAINASPEFLDFLRNPRISKEEKLAVMNNICEGRFSPVIKGFLQTVLEKDRQGSLKDILIYFSERMKEYYHIGKAYVTSAVSLTPLQKQKIEAKLLATTSYSKIETEYTVDAECIGGLIVRIGDRIVDSSIRTRLDKLSSRLLNVQLS